MESIPYAWMTYSALMKREVVQSCFNVVYNSLMIRMRDPSFLGSALGCRTEVGEGTNERTEGKLSLVCKINKKLN